MNATEITNHLESNAEVFKTMLSSKSSQEYTWRPDKASWTLLEIICHLYDEERDDFRARVKNTLETPHLQPPSIDPPGWVQERDYAHQNFHERLEAFLAERKNSILWLRSLTNAPWKNVYSHPTAGRMTANAFLVNWLAHDYHHIRQINRRCYEYLREKSGVGLSYAGDW